MEIKIECSEKEAQLISKALDLYCRIGLGQFWYLTDCNTVKKNLWKFDEQNSTLHIEKSEVFRQKATQLSNIYTGFTGNGSYGIFSLQVGEDCKEAAHIYQQIRHEFWKKDEDRNNFSVGSNPADICKIANITIPNFKIEINDNQTPTKYSI